MSKQIIFTQTEREILQHCLEMRIKRHETFYAHFFDENKKQHYAKYMTAPKSAMEKLMQSDTCILFKWEKLNCISVINDEYQSLSQNTYEHGIVYDINLHRSIINKCKRTS